MQIVLCDLDGTVADHQHRLHHLQGSRPNRKAFYQACEADPVIPHMAQLVRHLSGFYEVWFVTARPETYRDKTTRWLKENNIPYRKLLMRSPRDTRGDHVVKLKWLGTKIPRHRVAFALEDRSSVVEAWRDAGVPCLQVRQGDF